MRSLNMFSFLRGRASKAFTLIELLVVVAIIALLVAVLLPGLAEARRAARQIQNIANIANYGTGCSAYAAEFKDLIWGYTWRAGFAAPTRFPGLNPAGATNDVQAAAFQAVDIIRRRSNPTYESFPIQPNWIPHVSYSHLPVIDYLTGRLPEPMIRSPFDRLRQEWAEALFPDPASVRARFNLPSERAPYSSSYQIVSATYTRDKFGASGGSLIQGETSNQYLYDPAGTGRTSRWRLGSRKLSDVKFPSQKIQIMEDIARHVGKVNYFFTHQFSQPTCGFFDGSVRAVPTRNVNRGGYLTANNAVSRAFINYEASPTLGYDIWPDSSGLRGQGRDGFHRWTVGGLSGIDAGSGEPYR